MDFEIPEQCSIICKMVRDFVRKELEPIATTVDESENIPEEIVQKMKDLGFFGMTIPAEYGGSGFGLLEYCFAIQELVKAGLAYRSLISINNGLVSKCILMGGSEEQKKRYLPAMATGDKISAFALTEPQAGSDLAGIETTAVRAGDTFILNGTKHFITNGPTAHVALVVAVTDRSLRAKGGITCFLVDRGTPGFSVGAQYKTMGLRGEPIGELVFEDCVVPVRNVLGGVGEGFPLIMQCLAEGRATISAAAIGAAEKLLELSIDYAKLREQFGKPIGTFQAIQSMLADMATELCAARLMLYKTIWEIEQGKDVMMQASMVKLFSSEMVNRVADMAVQIHGGFGYTRENFIERAYRDVRFLRIVEGTSEIQRLIIARGLLRGEGK
jgi:acyl-CoA dehydrogenase